MDCDSVHLQLEQLQCGRQVDVADAPAAKPQALEASQVRKRRPQCRVGALRPRRIRRPQRQLRQRARQRRRVPASDADKQMSACTCKARSPLRLPGKCSPWEQPLPQQQCELEHMPLSPVAACAHASHNTVMAVLKIVIACESVSGNLWNSN